jgi:hypothetical protein
VVTFRRTGFRNAIVAENMPGKSEDCKTQSKSKHVDHTGHMVDCQT